MHRHPQFDLWLHDDDELAAALGSAPTERTTIHEWPLSSVQRVRTADGRRHIYKVQAPPTIEREVYARARSPLLVKVRALQAEGTTVAMVMDEVEAPRLNDIRPAEADAVSIAWTLVRQVAEIEGGPPSMTKIHTEALWATYFSATLEDLSAFVADGTFHAVDTGLVQRLRGIAEGAPLLEAIRSPSGFVHADLKAENVLVLPDGFRVLDWQRPIHGPVALDVATLLISLGLDPLRHVPVGVVQLYHLLLIAWFTQSARRWLPGGRPGFDGLIARIGAQVEGVGRGG